jgi:hypothetical protein
MLIKVVGGRSASPATPKSNLDGLTLVGGELDAAADDPELKVGDRAAMASG